MKLVNANSVQCILDEFFHSKSKDFYKKGIEELVTKWETVTENKDKYIID